MEDDGSPTVALGFGLAHRGLGVVAVEVRIGDLDQSGAAEAWLVAAVDNADGSSRRRCMVSTEITHLDTLSAS